MIGENVPEGFLKLEDRRLLTEYVDQYIELRRHLFAKHIKTLSRQERKQLKQGTHPSQSHKFADQAQPFATALEKEMKGMGYECRVTLGWNQMDLIVLDCDFDFAPENTDALPWLFRGLEIKYSWPST